MSEDFITIKRDDLAQLCIDIINARSDGRVAIRGGVDYAEEQIIRKVFNAIPSADRPHKVVSNGNCAICGKPLSGDRVFICEECSKKGADDE